MKLKKKQKTPQLHFARNYNFQTLESIRIVWDTYLRFRVLSPSPGNMYIFSRFGVRSRICVLINIVEIPMRTICGSQFEKWWPGMLNPTN